jgi:hypothetical protein
MPAEKYGFKELKKGCFHELLIYQWASFSSQRKRQGRGDPAFFME